MVCIGITRGNIPLEEGPAQHPVALHSPVGSQTPLPSCPPPLHNVTPPHFNLFSSPCLCTRAFVEVLGVPARECGASRTHRGQACASLRWGSEKGLLSRAGLGRKEKPFPWVLALHWAPRRAAFASCSVTMGTVWGERMRLARCRAGSTLW